MTATKIVLKNAPRDLESLQSITRTQRYQVFAALCDEAADDLSPGRKNFRKLESHEQALLLRDLLHLYDNKDRLYVVRGLALPLVHEFTTNKGNQIRWEKLAAAYEDAINELAKAGCTSVQSLSFGAQGVLLLGTRSPTPRLPQALVGKLMGMSSPEGFPPPQMSFAAPDKSRDVAVTMLRTVLMHSDATGEKITEQFVDEVVQRHLKPLSAETASNVLGALKEMMVLHEKAHEQGVEIGPAEDCQHLHELKLLKAAIEKHVNFQLC